MTVLYGIKNCDTVKKARQWLEQQQIPYRFHDVRDDGLDAARVQAWVAELGWENLVNKRSTTWKALDETTRASLSDTAVVAVILANPTLIKRPLLDHNQQRSCGFSAAAYQQRFARQ